VDCAAFSIPGPAGVEQLAVALVVDGDFSPELFEKVMAKKSPFLITAVMITAQITRNANGKIIRSALTEQYLGQRAK
jgi:acyl-CoA synthetase (AMP-forming)/AMP-acid ligase II